VLVQFGVDFLELCNSGIPRIRGIVDTSYECPQSRVVVESSQFFSNLNQLLDLPRSVFRLVVAQNQGNDPDNVFNKADNIMIGNLPICQMLGYFVETCNRIRLGVFLPGN
jgi:hypothetical protein